MYTYTQTYTYAITWPGSLAQRTCTTLNYGYDARMTEYEALEERLKIAREVWISEHGGSAAGFYEANAADMDRLTELHDASVRLASKRMRTLARETPKEPHERALIQLWLPMGQREAFRAKCMGGGKSMSERLRELIEADLA